MDSYLTSEATEQLRAAVARYALPPGIPLTGWRVGAAGVRITTPAEILIARPVTGGPHFLCDLGYRLYDVEPAGADPAGRSVGIALLPDGLSYHLNDAAGFRAFYAALQDRLSGAEVAGLLAWYQSGAPGAERLVISEEDVADTLGPLDRLTYSALFRAPVWETASGARALAFTTFFLSRDAPDRIYQGNLNAWTAEAGEMSRLTWASRPLARGLPSPRYSA